MPQILFPVCALRANSNARPQTERILSVFFVRLGRRPHMQTWGGHMRHGADTCVRSMHPTVLPHFVMTLTPAFRRTRSSCHGPRTPPRGGLPHGLSRRHGRGRATHPQRSTPARQSSVPLPRHCSSPGPARSAPPRRLRRGLLRPPQGSTRLCTHATTGWLAS